ncbi:pyridine nucleotide-disulfide oxidoreductase domain-containing protein 1 isoform X1 [Bemisia tabaci]|uniref:pyridine nucleotide-disulfide oxidoreductase domain-containing protein 1 isoform X1 n=1 Tax=Bemisia tabaci TaxID=7038 RepID=UPI003B285E26
MEQSRLIYLSENTTTKTTSQKTCISSEKLAATYIVVGGGIAGVSCVESISFLDPDEPIILITASPLVKCVANIINLSKVLTQFDVKEQKAEYLLANNPSLKIIQDELISINSTNKEVKTASGLMLQYNKLCICTGASPKVIPGETENIIGIRDTDSVKDFQSRIKNARKIVLVGNGGIATEIVHKVENVEIIWVIKDKHISATFIDPGAAEFFQEKLKKNQVESEPQIVKRLKYSVSGENANHPGAALGPDWHSNIDLIGKSDSKVTIEYTSEVKSVSKVSEEGWCTCVELTNGKRFLCDFVVSATGVIPNSGIHLEDKKFQLNNDLGISVNWLMETNVEDIYASGDVCGASWELADHWFQMRLWTQARQMGMYAAKCMVAATKNEEVLQDFCFELFSHVTKFFGFKVVLLGLFNGQKLDNNYEILLRVTKDLEYVKLILKNGRMQGAVLIGETDLEEMCENLILNQLDLTDFGEDLLNPDIDIDDYFD